MKIKKAYIIMFLVFLQREELYIIKYGRKPSNKKVSFSSQPGPFRNLHSYKKGKLP